MSASKYGLSWKDAPEWADILIRDTSESPVYLWVEGAFEAPGEHRIRLAGGDTNSFRHRVCTFKPGHAWELLATRNPVKPKHPYDAVIRAWLDGADVEWFSRIHDCWIQVENVEQTSLAPSFYKETKWRIVDPHKRKLERAVLLAQSGLDAYLAQEEKHGDDSHD